MFIARGRRVLSKSSPFSQVFNVEHRTTGRMGSSRIGNYWWPSRMRCRNSGLFNVEQSGATKTSHAMTELRRIKYLCELERKDSTMHMGTREWRAFLTMKNPRPAG
ncbi:MAG: hypothetical protein M1596_03925 [Firmicutes bacterium]|nr:hypothetical protein [Bacillota bacterium]